MSAWIGLGIEPISKRKPESNIVGRKAERSATWLATNWFLVAAEISRPWPSAGNRNALAITKSANGEPRNGTPNTVIASTAHIVIESNASAK